MSKLYTGLGDDGTTGLLGRERVLKSDLRLETIGNLDELSAHLGFAKCQISDKKTRNVIDEIQRDLYGIMTNIAISKEVEGKFKPFNNQRVEFLEKWITTWGTDTVLPDEFILPGETLQSAIFSINRTITRRVERRLVEMKEAKIFENPDILRYINRLSSLLYLLEIKFSKKGNDRNLKFAKISL